MKILFIANRFPYPPFRGDKLKIYNLAKRLAKKHELHLITFTEQRSDTHYLPELEAIFSKIEIYIYFVNVMIMCGMVYSRSIGRRKSNDYL